VIAGLLVFFVQDAPPRAVVGLPGEKLAVLGAAVGGWRGDIEFQLDRMDRAGIEAAPCGRFARRDQKMPANFLDRFSQMFYKLRASPYPFPKAGYLLLRELKQVISSYIITLLRPLP
jgi:hypothetical protein